MSIRSILYSKTSRIQARLSPKLNFKKSHTVSRMILVQVETVPSSSTGSERFFFNDLWSAKAQRCIVPASCAGRNKLR